MRLQVEEFTGATVLPFQQVKQGVIEMGAVDKGGDLIEDSLITRSYGKIGRLPEIIDCREEDVSEVIYAGPLFNHYGHFLLESLSRLWAARYHPDRDIVFSCTKGIQDQSLNNWQREIMEFLGLADCTILLDRPVKFKSVLVPNPGYRNGDYFHEEHAESTKNLSQRFLIIEEERVIERSVPNVLKEPAEPKVYLEVLGAGKA